MTFHPYRCRECTLLRVDIEGAVCEECAANMPAASGLSNSTPAFMTPAQIMSDIERTFSKLLAESLRGKIS